MLTELQLNQYAAKLIAYRNNNYTKVPVAAQEAIIEEFYKI